VPSRASDRVKPRNLRRLKKAVRERWRQVPLIDMVTEAALRTGMLGELTAVGSREALQRSVLWERLLLVAYAYGTNTSISAVAACNHGHSEADLRYTARRYFTIDGARLAAIQLADATFAARDPAIWGQSTTTVASDSTHFRAYDQNLFTEWHSRYGGRGVLIYIAAADLRQQPAYPEHDADRAAAAAGPQLREAHERCRRGLQCSGRKRECAPVAERSGLACADSPA